MTQKIITICLIMSFTSFLISGCFTPDDVRLTDKQKLEYIDSIYQDEYKRLQSTIDVSCEQNFEKSVNRAVDSLVNVYLDSTKYDY